jgi:1-acyl-sn-glycerol-3-phosphate acyltransferase
VAREAKVPIVPLAGRATQEMYFNLFARIANLIGLSRLYDHLLRLPYGIGWLFYQIKSGVWMTVITLLSIPLPVKSGIVFGEPLYCGDDESTEHFAARVQQALQDLIDEHNPGGLNFKRAMKQRFRQTRHRG